MDCDAQDEAELGGIMAAAGLDGDGTLNYEEFIAATANLNKLERESNILAAFNKFDTDHSGALTRDEIAEALSSSGSTDEEVQVGLPLAMVVTNIPWRAALKSAWVLHCTLACSARIVQRQNAEVCFMPSNGRATKHLCIF